MEIGVSSGSPFEVEAGALVVPIYESEDVNEGFLKELNERAGGAPAELIGSDEMQGKSGDFALIHKPGDIRAKRLLLVGAGKREETTGISLRKMSGSIARFIRNKGIKTFALVDRGDLAPDFSAQAYIEGVIIALFETDTYKSREREERQIDNFIIAALTPDVERSMNAVLEKGRITAEAVNYARELANKPSCELTPIAFSEEAKKAAEEFGLGIDIIDETRMSELGMGALLGVARGSDEPPRLIVLTYDPPSGSSKGVEIIAVVGKGITFDSGGISIKSADGMELMKYDMSGAAATLASMRAIAQLKPGVKVIGIMPCSENMPSGKALKPGDILKTIDGKTIEVINTDAEGRLILADAIAYGRILGATRIIDLATLTGSVAVALGSINTGLLGNDQGFIDAILKAAREAGEKMWQLPMDEEYRESIKSDIADIKNSGGRYGGTITAAFFLREFVEDTPWVHLDIAGTAWETERKPHMTKGPTGVGIRTIIKYIESI